MPPTIDYWSNDEDVRLLTLIATHGLKWKTFAATHFPTRSVAAIRNRWLRIERSPHPNFVRFDEDALHTLGLPVMEAREEAHAPLLTVQHVHATCATDAPSV